MTQLRPEQLTGQLRRALAPVYFIHGDETLVVNECADAMRAAARAQGYADRQVFNVEAGFDWNALRAACDSLSLFSERRLLELRLPGGKPGKEGGAALRDYAERPAEDTVLLIVSGKLEPAARNSKWVQGLDKAGVARDRVAGRSRPAAGLDRAAHARARHAGRAGCADAAGRARRRQPAGRRPGNRKTLPAATVPGMWTWTPSPSWSLDSARYDVFGLVDSALAGDAVHAQRVLVGLRAEGVDPVLVLWALAREIRALAAMATDLESGLPGPGAGRHRVWEKRKPVIGRALQRVPARRWRDWLQRCARIDRVIKGRATGSCWDELLQLSLDLAGLDAVRISA